MQAIYVGIDVSREDFHLSIIKGQEEDIDYKIFSNSQNGYCQLKQYLRKNFKTASIYVALESTGPYSQALAEYSQENGYHTYVINPRHIKRFSEAMLCHIKTDKIDSEVIAHFIVYHQERLVPFYPLNENEKLLKAYTNRRTTLMVEHQRSKNHLEAHKNDPSFIIRSIKKSITFFEKQLKEIEENMRILIRSNEDLKDRFEALNQIKGVGKITIYTMLSMVPELGKLKHKKLTALIGLAPYTVQSGKSQKRGKIRQGRKNVKTVLYMAALSAIKFNPILKEFYERLKSKGKPFKVAITAVMRKLLVAMNAVIRDYYIVILYLILRQ